MDNHSDYSTLLPAQDMFHSRHPAASLHAAARAASGGPVYVSDAPSCHDSKLSEGSLPFLHNICFAALVMTLHAFGALLWRRTIQWQRAKQTGPVARWGAAQHNLPPGAAGALLKRLVLPDGSVLRAARPALPTRNTLFCDVLRDRHTLLKVGMQVDGPFPQLACHKHAPVLHLVRGFVQK